MFRVVGLFRAVVQAVHERVSDGVELLSRDLVRVRVRVRVR